MTELVVEMERVLEGRLRDVPLSHSGVERNVRTQLEVIHIAVDICGHLQRAGLSVFGMATESAWH